MKDMNTLNPEVILVDRFDQEIGIMNKLEAHQKGLLHRAFSIFIFNNNQELLIHQRAAQKYHGGKLWTNTCCSHPFPGEEVLHAAHRRLHEEMGISCPLAYTGHLLYQVTVENDLIEHEFDHIFIGHNASAPNPNPEEVMDWRWINLPDLDAEIRQFPEKFTYWFKMILPMLQQQL